MNKPTTLLIVDDDPIFLTITRAQLQTENYQLLTAQNGRTAWDMLSDKENMIDVALVDRMMPEMDGMHLLYNIKQFWKRRFIPVIMITSHATPAEYQLALDEGVFDFLFKPVDKNNLLSIIKDALRYRENILEKI